MWMRRKRHLCKLHNEVFKAAESRINTEWLPFVEGMNRRYNNRKQEFSRLPFAGRDESYYAICEFDPEKSALHRKG